MPFLYETAGRYVAACMYADRQIPIDAGFNFSVERKEFWSTDPRIAYRLLDYAHPDTKLLLEERFKDILPKKYKVRAPQLKASSAFTQQVKRYQVRGALHILRNSSSYLWYEAGTGKTATATLALEYLSSKGYFNVVVCPSALAATWREEIARVSHDFLEVHILETKVDRPSRMTDVLIVPEGLLTEELIEWLSGSKLGAMIVDEAHDFKNETSGRTRLLTKREEGKPSRFNELFRHVCLMSGTPTPNYKPIELWPVVNAFAPWAIGFRNKLEYGIAYCGATEKDDGYGYDYNKVGDVELLIAQLKKSGYLIYQELQESDVPAQAPDQYIYLDPKQEDEEVNKALNALEERLSLEEILELALVDNKDLARKYDFKLKIKGESLSPVEFMAELRKIAEVNTAHASIKALEAVLTGEKMPVVVFAWHKEAIEVLTTKLKKFNPLVIDGSVHKSKRQGIVDEFQNSKEPRPIIVNLQAGGVGFTMTRAYKCYFVGFSYVDGQNEQCVRRLRRIGQTRIVMPYYFIFKNSLAHTMLGILGRKQNNKARFLNALKGVVSE